VRLRDRLPGRLARVGQGRPGHAEVHRQRHQPLLRAVVQVPLDPAPLGVGGRDDLGAAPRQRLHPQRQLLSPARAEQRPPEHHVRLGNRTRRPRRRQQQRRRDQDRRDGGARSPARVAPEDAGEPERDRQRQPARRHKSPARPADRHGQQVIAKLPPGAGRPPRPQQPGEPGAAAARRPGQLDPEQLTEPRPLDLPAPPHQPRQQHRAGQGHGHIGARQVPRARGHGDQAPDRRAPEQHQEADQVVVPIEVMRSP
jgi:hypothetical protein